RYRTARQPRHVERKIKIRGCAVVATRFSRTVAWRLELNVARDIIFADGFRGLGTTFSYDPRRLVARPGFCSSGGGRKNSSPQRLRGQPDPGRRVCLQSLPNFANV